MFRVCGTTRTACRFRPLDDAGDDADEQSWAQPGDPSSWTDYLAYHRDPLSPSGRSWRSDDCSRGQTASRDLCLRERANRGKELKKKETTHDIGSTFKTREDCPINQAKKKEGKKSTVRDTCTARSRSICASKTLSSIRLLLLWSAVGRSLAQIAVSPLNHAQL